MLLKEPKFREVKIAAASSTTEPEWAQLCMSLFKLDGGVAMDSLFSNTQIYPIHNKVLTRTEFSANSSTNIDMEIG